MSERGNQVASLLMVGGTLLVAAAAVADIVYGADSPYAAHRNPGDVGRALFPGLIVLLFGTTFLTTPPSIADADPQSLPWLQRPRIRRGFAYAYFALAAALIVVGLA